MKPKYTCRIMWPLLLLIVACDSNESDLSQAASSSGPPPTQFDGVWEVFGRTGNEDGSNEPACGKETGYGKATIKGSKITGNIANKSGFEYTVEGTIDHSGKIKAMLIYSGYDAAELFGTFSAETNSAKGHWKDAVNACPGVWNATRITTPSPEQIETEEKALNSKTDQEGKTDSG